MTSKGRKSEDQVGCLFALIHIQEPIWSRSAFVGVGGMKFSFKASKRTKKNSSSWLHSLSTCGALFSLHTTDRQTIKISSAVINRSSKKNSYPFHNYHNAFEKISLNVFEKRLRGRSSQMLKRKQTKSSGSMRTESGEKTDVKLLFIRSDFVFTPIFLLGELRTK